jgi:leader peptidase (prepilin peptidase) / N-methyltransferase
MLIILLLISLLGLSIGSFLNALIYRLHKGKSLGGRSFCPKCKNKIAWYDNIPLASFFILRGKCRKCGSGISWQYPAVELVAGLLFLIAFILEFSIFNSQFSNNFQFLNFQSISNIQYPISNILNIIRNWFIVSVMIIIFIYDLRWYLIPDKITLPSIAVIFLLNLFLGVNLWLMLVSGIIGGGVFLFQYLVSSGRWVGGGDIRLGFLMGIALGWPFILVALFLAYLIGSIAAVFLVLAGKKKWGSKIPFGVFLATATVITLFWGRFLIDWYLGVLGY